MNLRITSILCLLLLALAPMKSKADAYALKEGEGITFYPVSTELKKTVKGYDCFYVPTAYKNGKSVTGAQYRFLPDANGLTPFSEIEGHAFVITSAFTENEDKKVERQNYLCFLIREDGKKLMLRIPYIVKNADNELTRAMSLWLGGEKYRITIPGCAIDQFVKIRKSFKNRWIVFDGTKSADKTMNELTNYINEEVPKDLFKHTDLFYCDSVAFADVKGYHFKQPIMFLKYQDKPLRLPAFDFRGLGESVYGSVFNMGDYFIEKSQLMAETMADENLYTPAIKSYIGKDVWYQHAGSTTFETYDHMIPWCTETESEYVLASNKRYHCKGMDICTYNDRYNSLVSLLFEDADKNTFQIGIGSLAYNNKRRSDKVFITDEEYKQLHADEIKAENERKAEERRKAAEKQLIKNVDKLKTGMTKDQVRKLLGTPDYVNSTQNAFTTLEQWVYGQDCYLYFSGDKLKTIDNYGK